MLEYLRKHGSSFFSKLLLGLIALIFALYFGFSGGGPPVGGTAPIAKVNGQGIPSGLYFQSVQDQLSAFQKMGQGSAGDDLQKTVESQVLQTMISRVLFSQAAHDLGLRVTNQELADSIRKNPLFQSDGQFNENFYLDQFKPFYQNQNGQDFEYTLREMLLTDKLRNVIDQAGIVSRLNLEDTALVHGTQLKVRRVEIPLGKEPNKYGKDKAVELAQEWIALRKENKPTEEFSKEKDLREEETELKNLQYLQAYFGGEDSLPILYCLLTLKPGEVCMEPYQVGNTLVAVQLSERQDASPNPEETEKLKNQLATATQNQFLSGVNDLLTQKAKIETFLSQP